MAHANSCSVTPVVLLAIPLGTPERRCYPNGEMSEHHQNRIQLGWVKVIAKTFFEVVPFELRPRLDLRFSHQSLAVATPTLETPAESRSSAGARRLRAGKSATAEKGVTPRLLRYDPTFCLLLEPLVFADLPLEPTHDGGHAAQAQRRNHLAQLEVFVKGVRRP